MKRALILVVALVAAASGRSLAAPKPCTVPAAWGPIRNVAFQDWQGGTLVYMVFEDAQGNVHVLNRNKCEPREDLEISRR